MTLKLGPDFLQASQEVSALILNKGIEGVSLAYFPGTGNEGVSHLEKKPI